MGRVMVAEQLLNELLKGFGMAGQAVNRLESFTFSLVALIIKKEIASIDEIRELQKELQQHEDLNEFWGVEPPPEEEAGTDEVADDS
jgi:hypothetical protein